MKIFSNIFSVVLIVLGSQLLNSAAIAQNTMFMRESPIANMDEQDRQILRDTINELLESPDGTVIDWSNPDTGSGGRVKVLDTNETAGMTCRNVRARNQARGRKQDGTYNLCKDETGTWRFAKAGKPQAPKTEQPARDEAD